MAQKIQDIMSTGVATCPHTATIVEAAQRMRDEDIGDVLVERDGDLCGLVTDRDIVVRAVAQGDTGTGTTIGEICSRELTTVKPSDDVGTAVRLMREKAIRRLPVVDNGRPVGVVTLGDLAMERDEQSVLADISEAAPNN
jgi:CBS domain-containing protein